MLVILFFEKGASKYLKMPFYESFLINCVMLMVLLLKFSVTNWQHDQVSRNVVFVSCETYVQLIEVKAVKK